MRGDGGNHQERLGHKRISCASQFTMPNMAGMSPDPTCNFTDTRSSQHHQASRTPDFSYKLVSSTSFSLSSPSLSFSSTTLPLLQHTKLSHLSLSLHVMIMSLHRVQHIPSTSIHRVQAYTEYKHTPSTSIHRVQHTPTTASTRDCLSSLHSHDYELTLECSFSFRCASLPNRPPSARSP